MAGDLLLRCVPDPNNGPGTSPCPQGYIIGTVEAQLPVVVSIDDWSTYAAEASVALVLAYAGGFVLGGIAKWMKEATR